VAATAQLAGLGRHDRNRRGNATTGACGVWRSAAADGTGVALTASTMRRRRSGDGCISSAVSDNNELVWRNAAAAARCSEQLRRCAIESSKPA
jgi:hypothetical protein